MIENICGYENKSDPIPNHVRDSEMPMGTGRGLMSKTPINDKEFK